MSAREWVLNIDDLGQPTGNQQRRPPMPTAVYDKIQKLREQGYTWKQIAKGYGVSQATLKANRQRYEQEVANGNKHEC